MKYDIDVKEYGLDIHKLTELGFKKGTAFGILRGEISKKSLEKLFKSGYLKEFYNDLREDNKENKEEKLDLYGEYIGRITYKDFILEGDGGYKVMLYLDIMVKL